MRNMIPKPRIKSRAAATVAVLAMVATVQLLGGERFLPALLDAASGLTGHRKLGETKPRAPVLFMGIFSTRGADARRNLLRTTMLKLRPYNHRFSSDDRICRLEQYQMYIDEDMPHRCRVVYGFILGGADDGGGGAPTHHRDDMLMDDGQPRPIVVDHPKKRTGACAPTCDHEWGDIVYLNIQESMNMGKTPTFFKWASQLSDWYDIDYIVKTDEDTLVGMDHLIDFMDRDLPAKPAKGTDRRRMYGGFLVDYHMCGGHAGMGWCKTLVGKAYMAGQFYFLSTDLAKYVSSDDLDRTKIGLHFEDNPRQNHEDLNMGLWVHSYPGTVKLVVMSRELIWHHPVKSPQQWQTMIDNEYETGLPHAEYRWRSVEDCIATHGSDANIYNLFFECKN